jgi:hypothetical protein
MNDVNDCLSALPLESETLRTYCGTPTEFMSDTNPRALPEVPAPSFRSAVRSVATIYKPIALPAPGTQRWVVRRKAAIVEAVKQGQLTQTDACRTYGLSTEEFQSWQRLVERHGTRGLRTTRLKEYRARAVQPGES